MNHPANNSRSAGILVVILALWGLSCLKTVCRGDLTLPQVEVGPVHIQITGDVHFPGVYVFMKEPGPGDVIRRAGGLLIKTSLPPELKYARLKSGLLLNVQNDGRGLRVFQLDMSAFHKITLGASVNINQESVEGLTALPGVGNELARSIVNERIKRGAFNSLIDLLSIKGIGYQLYGRIRPYVQL
ncbi:ComEA family DNA-binding protein [Thermodesulfobacteriota bacterium]